MQADVKGSQKSQNAEKVNECDNDVKKLYNLVNHLMGRNLGHPLSRLRKQPGACKWVCWFLYGENQGNYGQPRSTPNIWSTSNSKSIHVQTWAGYQKQKL